MPQATDQATSMPPTSDRARGASSTSPPPQTKVAAKISCLACRAAKRKCITPDAFTVCKRCTDQGLDCEYKKHRRGRRKKTEEGLHGGDGRDRSSPGRSASPSQSPEGAQRREHRQYSHEGGVARQRDYTRSSAINEARPHSIRFSHVVPVEGDSSPYLPRPGAPPELTSEPAIAHLRTGCPDPVASGILSDADAYELFDFYFHHLNVTVAVLDPVLHTATYCRDKCPLLFSAVLTVTAKVIRPEAYSSCLLIANKLTGQAIEYGLCSVEVVQALLILTHWKKADDPSAWRKTGYAIRMAQELRLHQRAKRPLPRNERHAREILNRERCWLNLIVADYHLAMHHSLPKMINEDDIDDPIEWILEHPHLPCPGEALIAPWISFSRMTRLFADMLASMNGSQSNMRSLHWLEMEWKRWRRRWIDKSSEYNLSQHQVSTIRICDGLLGFHICEYRTLFCARYRSKGQQLDTSQPSELSYAFAACVDQALDLLEVFQTEFVSHGFLPFCFNLTWVGVAITSVWLIKNVAAMDQTDRGRVIRMLSAVSDATRDSSRSSEDMASYTHRLLKHLLGNLPSEILKSANAPPPTIGIPPNVGSVDTTPTQAASAPALLPTWTMPSAQQIIQEQLWNSSLFDVYTPTNDQASSRQTQRQPPTIMSDGVPGQLSNDMLFPAADDDIWKLLFPL